MGADVSEADENGAVRPINFASFVRKRDIRCNLRLAEDPLLLDYE